MEAGFWLYSLIAKSNELGLAPQVYEIYESVIKLHLAPGRNLRKEEISKFYVDKYGRPLPWQRLDREILPALQASGLISLQPDPDDRRRMVVCTPDSYNISAEEPSQNNIVSIWGATLGERVNSGIMWLNDSRNLHADGWGPLDKFTEVVGGPETVRHMVREGLIELHPTEPNKVRLVRK